MCYNINDLLYRLFFIDIQPWRGNGLPWSVVFAFSTSSAYRLFMLVPGEYQLNAFVIFSKHFHNQNTFISIRFFPKPSSPSTPYRSTSCWRVRDVVGSVILTQFFSRLVRAGYWTPERMLLSWGWLCPYLNVHYSFLPRGIIWMVLNFFIQFKPTPIHSEMLEHAF